MELQTFLKDLIYQIISKSEVALPEIEQNKNNLQSEKTLIKINNLIGLQRGLQ